MNGTLTTFKFRYVVGGNATGFMATKGQLTEEGLKLGDFLLGFSAVVDSTTRDDRVVLTIDSSDPGLPVELRQKLQQDHFLVLHISGMKAEALERLIDRHASVHEAEACRARLVAEGRGEQFRTTICPCCSATVNLSELPETPYVYCRFCETLFGQQTARLGSKNSYRHCDECGYFDRVQGYGEFYFYFLLVVYGFRHQRRHMCDDCGAKLANKLLAINSIFILGVPNALACAFRARAGRDPELSPLAKANRLAKKGKMDLAGAEYQKVLDVLPGHPGVQLNMARGYFTSQRSSEGLQSLRQSIDQCANFDPAITIAARISQG